ncbi:hypothetical protein HMN09_00923600 [Mycena chlorophos]|uniref:Uncharacterized protein n=1 Tax=Mycena chlorophos TaxID=658473 RepID=A0A8H6W5V0_MYCCL|nr:hypothetical protein HMN09_00923600 [Mycena chlorophos]
MASSTSTVAASLRTSSLAVAAFDYLQTLPFEVRLVLEARKAGHVSTSFGLFLLIRYTSVLVLVTSNVSYFSTDFTPVSCARYFLLPTIFKLIQAMASQAILGVRVYNLSRQSRRMGWLVLVIYCITCVFQWGTSVNGKHPVFDAAVGNCASTSPNGEFGGWIFYTIAILYDFFTTALSGFLIMRMLPRGSSMLSRVFRMMLVDGLWYFIALCLTNLLSLGFYRATYLKFPLQPQQAQSLQTAAASLGYCLRWIMTQKLLIHLHEVAAERRLEAESRIEAFRTPTLKTYPYPPETTTFELTIPASESGNYEYGGASDLSSTLEEDGRHLARSQGNTPVVVGEKTTSSPPGHASNVGIS